VQASRLSATCSPDKQLLVLDANYFPTCTRTVGRTWRPSSTGTQGLASDADASRVRMVMRTDTGVRWRMSRTAVRNTYRELFLDRQRRLAGDDADEPRSPSRWLSTRLMHWRPRTADGVFDTAPFEQTVELAGHFRSTLWCRQAVPTQTSL